ncbi:hypothetical protein [Aurantimonas endophytica]|uniref:Uncharacterized protein n=1 Tax=Aurantimonas endophytica TaxID=1522175 RepID=A0A7W6HHB9_9HYPH|nr:hypothetical protein [Aurantimonas endophytica]MBB4005197.1 hypothetical protein [Aurantimonas endophytica]MCO6406140.1 hypothetical protein [Aurantimonas endophytica]
MRNVRPFTIAVFSATLLSGAALAQEATPQIPGSDATIELNRAAEREAVAATPGNETAPKVNSPVNDTIVPGNDAEIQLNRAAEREAVAEGVTGGTVGTADTASDVLVPGSGATFSPSTSPVTQSGEALQDTADTTVVQ